MVQIIQEQLKDKTQMMEFNKTHHLNAHEIIPPAKNRTYEDICGGKDAIFISVKILPGEIGSTSYNIIANKNFASARSFVHRALAKQRAHITELSVSCIEDPRVVNDEAGLVVDAVIRLKDSDEQFLPQYMVTMLEDEISSIIDGVKTAESNVTASKDESAYKFGNKPITEPEHSNDNNADNRIITHYDESGKSENATTNRMTSNTYENEAEESARLSQPAVSDFGTTPFSSRAVFDFFNSDEKNKGQSDNSHAPEENKSEHILAEKDGVELNTTSAHTIQNLYGANYFNENLDKKNEDAQCAGKYTEEPTIMGRATDRRRFDYKDKHILTEDNLNVDLKKKTNISQKEAYENASLDMPFLNAINEYVPQSDISQLTGSCPMYKIEEEDAHIRTTLSKTTLKECFAQVLRYFTENERTLVNRTMRGEIPPEKLITEIQQFVNRTLNIPSEDLPMFLRKIERAYFSYYVLTAAINDPEVSDIRVLAPDNINVKVHGKHYTVDGLSFVDEADYFRYIEMLLTRNGVSFGGIPIKVFTDKDYHPDYRLRFNVCLPSINTTEMPYLHIRKVPKHKTSLEALKKAGMLDDKLAAYLLDKVVTSRGIVFAGPSASGKTTLMNALIDYIPKEKSILCIQESEELFSDVHPNAYFQHMLKDERGNIVLGLSELGQNGLLCDSGVFIIGESKGAEVRDLLRASNTGHQCWTSVHSQNTRETIPRLADYVKYGSSYSFTEATRMLKDLEVIIYIQDFKITEISEIAGYDDENDKIIYRAIYNRSLDKSR